MQCNLAFFVVAILSLACGWHARAEPAAPAYRRPVLIRVEGAIGPWLEHYLYRKIERAQAAGCDLLIFEIDSPGGGVHETLSMCDAITALSGIHTVAFVPREALSGGAILSLACDEIIVGETARIGDAGMIEHIHDMGFRHAEEKVRSHLVARVRALAEEQSHPPALAEAMVDKTVKVLRVRLPDGRRATAHRSRTGGTTRSRRLGEARNAARIGRRALPRAARPPRKGTRPGQHDRQRSRQSLQALRAP